MGAVRMTYSECVAARGFRLPACFLVREADAWVAVAMESDGKGAYVLSNLAEVVERILSFLPTKALLRAAW